MIDLDVQAALTDIRAHIQRDYEAVRERFAVFFDVLNHVSVRVDQVSDQADRLDGAQTDLESRLIDVEETARLALAQCHSLRARLELVESQLDEARRLLSAANIRMVGL
jgi:chromosome segregation ATPase